MMEPAGHLSTLPDVAAGGWVSAMPESAACGAQCSRRGGAAVFGERGRASLPGLMMRGIIRRGAGARGGPGSRWALHAIAAFAAGWRAARWTDWSGRDRPRAAWCFSRLGAFLTCRVIFISADVSSGSSMRFALFHCDEDIEKVCQLLQTPWYASLYVCDFRLIARADARIEFGNGVGNAQLHSPASLIDEEPPSPTCSIIASKPRRVKPLHFCAW